MASDKKKQANEQEKLSEKSEAAGTDGGDHSSEDDRRQSLIGQKLAESRSEKKRNREQKRRNEVNEGLDRLTKVLFIIDPDLKAAAQTRATKAQGASTANEAQLLSRVELINCAAETLARIYQENEQYKILTSQLGMTFLAANRSGGRLAALPPPNPAQRDTGVSKPCRMLRRMKQQSVSHPHWTILFLIRVIIRHYLLQRQELQQPVNYLNVLAAASEGIGASHGFHNGLLLPRGAPEAAGIGMAAGSLPGLGMGPLVRRRASAEQTVAEAASSACLERALPGPSLQSSSTGLVEQQVLGNCTQDSQMREQTIAEAVAAARMQVLVPPFVPETEVAGRATRRQKRDRENS